MNKPEFIITSETGRKILDWCNSGTAETATIASTQNIDSPFNSEHVTNTATSFDPGNPRFAKEYGINSSTSKESILYRISTSNTIAELLAIYKQYPEYQQELKPEYETKKSFLIKLSNPQNFSTNGHH